MLAEVRCALRKSLLQWSVVVAVAIRGDSVVTHVEKYSRRHADVYLSCLADFADVVVGSKLLRLISTSNERCTLNVVFGKSRLYLYV
jgi:hypothetical protein